MPGSPARPASGAMNLAPGVIGGGIRASGYLGFPRLLPCEGDHVGAAIFTTFALIIGTVRRGPQRNGWSSCPTWTTIRHTCQGPKAHREGRKIHTGEVFHEQAQKPHKKNLRSRISLDTMPLRCRKLSGRREAERVADSNG